MMVQPGMPNPQLHSVLDVSTDSCLALIGGGGKTTLMLALAVELRALGLHPVVTTTTKIWVPSALPLLLDDCSGLREVLDRAGWACVGSRVSPQGKMEGVGPEQVAELLALGFGPVLVEADGAAGRPLKAHASHEPVVPGVCTHVLLVAGMDAIGRPLNELTVHRSTLAAEQHRCQPGAPISPRLVAQMLLSMERFVPAGARSWFVLNKVDGPAQTRAASEVAGHLNSARTPVLLTQGGKLLGAECHVGMLP